MTKTDRVLEPQLLKREDSRSGMISSSAGELRNVLMEPSLCGGIQIPFFWHSQPRQVMSQRTSTLT